MSGKKRTGIECPVEVPSGGGKFGVFANAFRVVPDTGSECFLDFCVYSAQEQKAIVISRIRVHISFLPILYTRLGQELHSLDSSDAVGRLLKGQLVLSQPLGEDN